MTSVTLDGFRSVCTDPVSDKKNSVEPHQGSFFERIAHATENKRVSLIGRALRLIDRADTYLDTHIPALPHQKAIDRLSAVIEKRFSFLNACTAWVYKDSDGVWYRQLATCLAKLPLRSALNIVRMLYAIVREILYFAVHPLHSVLRLAKLCINLLDALTTPETWAHIGAGMVASSCGYSLVTATPFPLIGAVIGGALLIGGISIGVLKQALLAETGKKWQAVGGFLSLQNRKIPEAALTGFLMGLIVGGIQRLAQTHSKEILFTPDTAKEFVENFVKKNNLPYPSIVRLENGGKEIFVDWGSLDTHCLLNGNPLSSYCPIPYSNHLTVDHMWLHLTPSRASGLICWKHTYGASWDFERVFSFPHFNLGVV